MAKNNTVLLKRGKESALEEYKDGIYENEIVYTIDTHKLYVKLNNEIICLCDDSEKATAFFNNLRYDGKKMYLETKDNDGKI